MPDLQSKIQSIKESLNVSYVKPDISLVNKYCEDLSLNNDALDYLHITRGLTQETIENFKLGYDIEKNAISIPIYKRGELINIKYRHLDENAKSKYSQITGCEVWIYNEDGIEKGKAKGGILITEGEFDCISAWQAGFKNVVSPASGKDSYGVWLELLDSIPKVYISYDNDKPGKSASINLAERIGTDKSFEVQYPDGIKDANDYFKLHTYEEYRKLLANSRPYYKYKYQGVKDIIDSIREKKENILKLKCIPFVEWEEDWLGVLSGVSNIGKCHGKGTKILMYDGSIKNVEDIKEGEELMGVDSEPRKVLSLARGEENMYRVWERGEYYDVNESHILSLQKNRQNKETKENKIVKIEKTVKDFLSYTKNTQKSYRGWKTGVYFKEKYLDLDPYVLGLWLGDGTSSKPDITTMDNIIVKSINEFAKSIICNVRKQEQPNNKSSVYSITTEYGKRNPFLDLLKKYNLINNKHIPFDFKVNSEENRLKLLAGLIDTDGHLYKTKRSIGYEITQKNKQLSDDIVFLARSLGYRATIDKVMKSIKSIGFIGEYYRILIVGDLERIPVRISYKKSNFIPKKHWLTSNLEIESLGIGDYYGFTLDGDGLYLLNSFTVTHNTSYAMNIADEIVSKGIPCLVLPIERGIRTVGKRFLQTRYNKTSDELTAFDNSDWNKIIPDVLELPLFFSMPGVNDVNETVIKAKRLFNTGVVIVDHLDLLVRKSDPKNINVETSTVIQNFKQIGQEHGIIFIIVHHIKKQEGIGAVPKKPKIEDLKGSSSVYQDPEVVIMLSEPEKGQIEVSILKNKGVMGSKIYDFNTATGKIGYEPTVTDKRTPEQKNFDNF